MNFETDFIDSPDSPKINWLCSQLREIATTSQTKSSVDQPQRSESNWPTKRLELISASGVYRWFVPEALGGLGWSNADITSAYVDLASACLTTTFIITQRVAAIRRICASTNVSMRTELLPGLLDGSQPATVGISHLTTSRQHVREPVLRASPHEQGFVVNGFSPWVTGASAASNVVLGAELDDRTQILFVIPTNTTGVSVEPGFDLVALSDSQTGPVKCDQVMVERRSVLAGPTESVLTLSKTPSTGSFQTSALAIGLAQSAIDFIRAESTQRPDLVSILNALDEQQSDIKDRLFKLASGVPVCSNEELRTEANSLVLRATQAAMVAAKGAGYVTGHPVGRWCQEALFFLVWSCPQSVLQANLCELAGIEG